MNNTMAKIHIYQQLNLSKQKLTEVVQYATKLYKSTTNKKVVQKQNQQYFLKIHLCK